MKRSLVLLFAIVVLAGCSREAAAPVVASAPPERPTATATFWSDKTELFLEYPVLVRGEGSRFAIHLTRLSDFKPVPAGRAEVRLIHEGGAVETFSTDAPSKAGIFGVTVKPAQVGTVAMEIRLISPSLSDTHRLEHVVIYPSVDAITEKEPPVTEETMPFLKEQQWALDFATSLAQTGAVRESLLVPAEVSPRSGGQASVTAPLAGRLAGENLPVLGSHVTQGQVLAAVIPPAAVSNDRATLDLAKAEGQAGVDYARKDRERAARLVEAGAAPRKRLDEALTVEAIAQAKLHSADERIRQFDSARTAEGAVGSPAFAIRAPISGTIVEMSTSLGANVKTDDVLFRIVDTGRVYVSAIVPEAEYPKARGLTGAEIEIPGVKQPRPAGRLVSIGKVVEAASRTFPIVYEFNNSDGRIAINQTVSIRLFLSGTRRSVLIPEAALVDDGGRPVVFIQRRGEAFVRRPVDVGLRQSGMVEITSGVQAGDRIVTKGAYLIRLSAMSSQIPAHGHVH